MDCSTFICISSREDSVSSFVIHDQPEVSLLRCTPGRNPAPALAASAGVGLGQGVSVKHPRPNDSSARNLHHEQHPVQQRNPETQPPQPLPTSPPLPLPAKPQTSKEVIATNVQLLIEQLETGHSEGLTPTLPLWESSIAIRSGTSLKSPAETRCNPRRRPVCVEPAWPQGDEGSEGHQETSSPVKTSHGDEVILAPPH